jgi:hypothetical protein
MRHNDGTQRVSEHSGVQGQGPRKGSKEIAARRARLLLQCISQKGHYPRTGALILYNKIITDLVFPQGFFQGLFTQNISCAMCYGFCFMLPLI